MAAGGHALDCGLQVWLSPELWDHSPGETLGYIAKAAEAAEELHRYRPGPGGAQRRFRGDAVHGGHRRGGPGGWGGGGPRLFGAPPGPGGPTPGPTPPPPGGRPGARGAPPGR